MSDERNTARTDLHSRDRQGGGGGFLPAVTDLEARWWEGSELLLDTGLSDRWEDLIEMSIKAGL